MEYGISLDSLPLILVNGYGAIIAVFCMLVFYYYTTKRRQAELGTFIALLILGAILAMEKTRVFNSTYMGTIGAVASIVMFASPLVALVRIGQITLTLRG